MRLIINGYDIDLYNGTRLKQTKQANDIGDLDTRQSNFTNKITVPGTPNNVKAFNYLGIPGNQSNIPYQQNVTYLWGDNEELLIYKGWAVPKRTRNDDYDVYVYDGLIDFYKAIENRTLTDLGISELNHLKNLTTVLATWSDPSKPYRYNVADYNGKMTYDLGKLNIDYLIPSAKVTFLWDKLFEYIGWTYEGDAFDLDDFQDLWLSYPKTIGDDTQETVDAHVWDFQGAPAYYANSFFGMYLYSNVLTHNPVVNNAYFSSSNQTSEQPPDGEIITAQTAGLYKFSFSGFLAMENGAPYQGNFDIIFQTLVDGEPIFHKVAENVEQGENIEKVFYMNLEVGQSFMIFPAQVGQTYKILGTHRLIGDMSIDVDNVIGNNVDFEEAFIGMSINDFVTDIMVRLSLTAFPDVINKHIKFLMHNEIVNSETPEDWSRKFVKRLSEDYIYGSYGQKNRFAYKYNEKEGEHNDGFLYISNVNLPAEQKVYQSAFYTPEKQTTNIVGQIVKVYKFWEKEVKDDGSIKYKDLDNRFYLMKSKSVNASITVGSEVFDEDQAVATIYRENYNGLAFKEVVNNYYPTIYSILNRTKVQEHLLKLSATDIENIDFSTPKFIEQEGAYFILNKIKSWEPGELTVCEMLRLEKSIQETSVPLPPPGIILNSTTLEPDGLSRFNWGILNAFQFINYEPVDGCTIKGIQLTDSPISGGVPTGEELNAAIDEASGQHVFELPLELTEDDCGWWQLQVTDPNEEIVSNEQFVFIPCPEDPSNDPQLYVTVENDPNDVVTGSPMYRDVEYSIHYFTPTTGVFKCQQFNLFTGVPQGAQTVINLTELTEGTHLLPDVEFNQGIGWYKIELITDVITFEINSFIG